MTTDKALAKATITLEVLAKYCELNSKPSFDELMQEIVTRWYSDI